jgi:hypothetical protein
LASTLYTLLAGTAPFAGPTGEGMLSQMLRITTADVPPMPRTDVPAMVVDCLRAALAKQPDERPSSAAAFGAALQQVQADLGLAPTPIPVDAPQLTSSAPAAIAVLPAPGSAARIDAAPIDDATIDVVGGQLARPAVDHQSAAGAAQLVTDGRRIDPGGDTVLGRQRPPNVVDERGARRRWMVPVVAAGALAVGAGATVVVTRLVDDESTAGSTVQTTVALADPSAFRPTDVVVSEVDGSLIVQWSDRTGGQRPHLVYMFDETGAAPRSWNVDSGFESQIADGVEPSTPACFVVRAILDAGPPLVYADSEPACINGAVFAS